MFDHVYTDAVTKLRIVVLSFKCRLICLMFVSSLCIGEDASALAPQEQDPETRQKIEKRRHQFRELQELRFSRRAERIEELRNGSGFERNLSPVLREAEKNRLNNEDRPAAKLNRLSPEERMALRRQIREARQDIYLRRLQKK